MPQNELTPCHFPTKATLRKYGLSLDEWLEIYRNQKGCCAICKQPFGEKRINTDHVHVKGWKKMRPENRKKYVRGLLCFTCNRFLVMKGVTKEKLEAAAEYLWGFGIAFKFLNPSGDMQKGQQVLKRRNIRHPNQEQNQERHPG